MRNGSYHMDGLWVEERGEGELVLFVAGLGQASWTWRYQVPVVSAERRTVVFDPPGTGRSPGPPRTSIAEMAADAAAILSGRAADVVGLSMGGYVALTLALERPGLVRSLVLAATGAGGPERVPRPREVARAFNDALSLPYAEFTRATLPLAFAPGWAEANPERLEEILAARLEHPASFETLQAHVDACYRFYAEGIDAERIELPALVLHGDEDRIVPVENGRMLAARLPGAEYVELPGRGHNLPLEEPGTFNRLLLEFLRSRSGRL
jgi:pimeloyl-ACP methyl ester carboxylesterase